MACELWSRRAKASEPEEISRAIGSHSCSSSPTVPRPWEATRLGWSVVIERFPGPSDIKISPLFGPPYRGTVPQHINRRLTQCRRKTVLIWTILRLPFSRPISLSSRVSGRLGTERSFRRELLRRAFWLQLPQRSVSQLYRWEIR